MGKPYVTGYEPIRDAGNNVIGIFFVGYGQVAVRTTFAPIGKQRIENAPFRVRQIAPNSTLPSIRKATWASAGLMGGGFDASQGVGGSQLEEFLASQPLSMR